MRTNRHRSLMLAVSALALGSAAPAFAQDTSEGARDASDIVVTARRIEEKLQDVPISITVYNQEQISSRNIVNSTDLAVYTPSLAVNSRFGPEKASFALRGFSQDLNTQPTVAVYFAEVVAPRLSSNITSGNGAGVGSMFDLQNVQVLKGPQGTLFGRNTTGGAILLVPQKPKDKFEAYVEATIGSYNAGRVEAMVNVPVTDTIRVRAGIDRNTRNGYLRNRSGIGAEEFNDLDYFAARLSIVADITPKLENYTLFTYSKSDTNGMVGKIAFCNRGTIVGSAGRLVPIRQGLCDQFDREVNQGFDFYDVENSNPNQYVKSRTWQAVNTTTWNASDTLTVKNIFSYGEAKERYSFNINGDVSNVGGTIFPFVTTFPGPNFGQGHQWTLSEELQFQGGTADDRLKWQAGGYLERSSPIGGQEQYTAVYSNCADVLAFKCTPLFSSSSVGVAKNLYFYKNYGLYAQATYKLTEKFSLTAGIRNTWDWQRQTADNIRVTTTAAGPTAFVCTRAATPSPNPGIALISNGACGIGRTFVQESNRPTWLIDLDFKPTEDFLIFAKYARGYRGGGINESNSLAETWRPEKIDNYEIGIKGSLNGAVRANFSLTGFWNEFKDQQVSAFIPQCAPLPAPNGRATCTNPVLTGINGIQNIGKSRLRGIEADGMVMLGDNFRFEFGYAYLDAKVTGAGVPGVCDNTRYECASITTPAVGSVLPFAPKNRITLTGTYTLPLDESIGKISFGATFTHTDSQRFSYANDVPFAQGAIPYNPSIIPGTDLLNLNMSWKQVGGGPVDLSLFATNVTGKKYFVASTNALSSSGAEFLVLGEPRMVGGRIKINFGR